MLASSQEGLPGGHKTGCLCRTVKIGDSLTLLKIVHGCVALLYTACPWWLGAWLGKEVDCICATQRRRMVVILPFQRSLHRRVVNDSLKMWKLCIQGSLHFNW